MQNPLVFYPASMNAALNDFYAASMNGFMVEMKVVTDAVIELIPNLVNCLGGPMNVQMLVEVLP